MPTPSKTLIDLETKFWQSLVDNDADTAVGMLSEPALMVSPMGTIKFDHAGYRKMAEHGSSILTSYELSDMEVVFPNDKTAILAYRVKQRVKSRAKDDATQQLMNDTSTWIQTRDGWRCVMHTETPIDDKQKSH